MAKRQFDEYEDIMSNVPPKSQKSKKKKKKKMRGRDRAIMIVSILLIVASVLTVGGIGLLNWRPLIGDESQLDDIIKTPDAIREKSVNFLVCGVDFEEGSSRGKLTDIMMVVNFDVQGDKVNILQIPRDTLIGDDETSTGKMNAVYNRPSSYGENGMSGLAGVINKEFQISIDHYAMVNMTAFRKVVDGLGGVEMDVPQTVTWEGVTVKKGKQTLNGKQAEIFVRVRKGQGGLYDGSDITRAKMQRIFLAALAKKLTSVSFGTLAGLIPQVMGDVTTDMSVGEVINFAGAMQKVNLSNMNIMMLPGQSGYYRTKSGSKQSVYFLHEQETVDMLNQYFRPYQDPLSTTDLDLIETDDKKVTYNDENGNDFQQIIDGTIPGHESSSSKSGQ